MRILLATLVTFVIAASAAHGQGIAVDLLLDQEQYLPGESLAVKVRISNYSGQKLVFGKDPDWLTFTIEDTDHLVIPKESPIPVGAEFSLEPSMNGTKKVDLAPCFDLTRAGRYYVRAMVMMPQWGRTYQSKLIPFDIIKGTSFWEQEFGVPGTAKNPGAAPEMRRYALVETLQTKTLKLYFRLTDIQGQRIFKIYPLGQLVSLSRVEPQLDTFSNLHLIYQTGARLFTHVLINPDGVLIARETYEITDSRPALRRERDGRISVGGGVQRPSPGDLPPPGGDSPPINAKLDQP